MGGKQSGLVSSRKIPSCSVLNFHYKSALPILNIYVYILSIDTTHFIFTAEDIAKCFLDWWDCLLFSKGVGFGKILCIDLLKTYK